MSGSGGRTGHDHGLRTACSRARLRGPQRFMVSMRDNSFARRPLHEPSDCSRSRDREGAVAGHATITVFGPLAHARGSVGLDGSWSRCATTPLPSTLPLNRRLEPWGARPSRSLWPASRWPAWTRRRATPSRLNPALLTPRAGSWPQRASDHYASNRHGTFGTGTARPADEMTMLWAYCLKDRPTSVGMSPASLRPHGRNA
jgi:hypothetical protein